MKKILTTGVMFLSLAAIPTAQADVIPEGKKYVPTCANIYGISNFPKLAFYTKETGPTLEKPIVQAIKGEDCLDVGYKFNTLELYAINTNDTDTDGEYFDPTTSPYAYKSNLALDVADELVDENSDTEYKHNEYVIGGIDNDKKELYIAFSGSQTNLMIADAFPEIPEGLDKEIMTTSTPTDVFTDVKSNSTYGPALKYLKDKGVISGYPDGSFQPDKTINRAEFTYIMVKASAKESYSLVCEDFANDTNLFTDVKLGLSGEFTLWYINELCYAKSEKIIAGYDDGSFKPEEKINYAESVKVIANAFKIPVEPLKANEAWYQPFIQKLENELFAVPATIKLPEQKITRGEMAEMMYRIMKMNGDYKSKMIMTDPLA